MSLSDALWLATFLKSEKNTNRALNLVNERQESIYKLADLIGQTNDQLVTARSEHDAPLDRDGARDQRVQAGASVVAQCGQ